MKNDRKSRFVLVMALLGAAIFSTPSEGTARPYGYYGGGTYAQPMQGRQYMGNYGGAYSGQFAGGFRGFGRRQQNYPNYGYSGNAVPPQADYADNGSNLGAALGTPRSTPGYGSSGAGDYINSVCVQGAYTWEPESMPLRVYIGDGTGVPGYKPIFQDYLRRGFDMWCSVSNNKISWREVSSPQEANITVSWTNRVTERPEGTEAGRTSVLTRYNTVTGRGTIYGAKMLFLTQLPGRMFRDEEVEKTCIHEAGHAVGLQGHSPHRGDIMYYAVSPNQVPELSQRDKNTLARLYAGAPALDELALSRKNGFDASRR